MTKHTTGKAVKWVHWPAIDYRGVGQRQQPASHCRLGIPQPLLHLEEFAILASISESTFLNSLGLSCIEVDIQVFRYPWQCVSSRGFSHCSYSSWYLSSPQVPICSTSLKNKDTGCPPDVIRTGGGLVVAERVVHGAVCLWRTAAESNVRKSVPDIGAGSGFCKKGASSTISPGISLFPDESYR